MSLTSVSGYDYNQMALNGIQNGIQGVSQTDTTAVSSLETTAPQATTDQASISQTGQLMSQLQQLQTTDPAKFKAITQQISNDLEAKAQNGGNPMLAKLAQNFAQAAQSGSMDSLQPHKGKHSHGAGKHHGGSKAGGLLDEVNSVIANDLAGASNAGIGANSSASLNGTTTSGTAGATTAKA